MHNPHTLAFTAVRTRRLVETSWISMVLNALPLVVAISFVTLSILAVTLWKTEQLNYEHFIAEKNAVSVTAPPTMPRISQRNIDIAVELFNIDVPSNVVGPTLDRNLYDRGLTSGDSLGNVKTVAIGPAAFSSWGILGSTLGHEVEVHARQSFIKIVLLDKFEKIKETSLTMLSRALPPLKIKAPRGDLDLGTWRAEREAYTFEMTQYKRFGLNFQEVAAIHGIMNTYYPQEK